MSRHRLPSPWRFIIFQFSHFHFIFLPKKVMPPQRADAVNRFEFPPRRVPSAVGVVVVAGLHFSQVGVEVFRGANYHDPAFTFSRFMAASRRAFFSLEIPHKIAVLFFSFPPGRFHRLPCRSSLLECDHFREVDPVSRPFASRQRHIKPA